MAFGECRLMMQMRALLRFVPGLLLPLLLLPQNLPAAAREPDWIINLWSGQPPGNVPNEGAEQDFTKPEDRLIAGRPIIKLGNVSVPQAHVYLPPVDQRTGSAVVICPGGGFNILAWDLEGTEVAEWLNSIGVTAVVLKYRVPTSRLENKWLAPVQDAQRCVSLVRAHADDWGVAPDRTGLLGFSAGGATAVRAALASDRMYDASDEVDHHSCQVNAAIVIYPAYLTNDAKTELRDDLKVTGQSPPMFLVHAADDPVTAASSLHLALALQQQGVAVELHLFDTGGHGYGLRPVEELPVTRWNDACTRWLQRNGWAR